MKEGVPLPCRITVNSDRSYNLSIHSPPATFLLKQAAGVQKAAMYPGQEIAGKISLKHLYEIAAIKIQDPPNGLRSMKVTDSAPLYFCISNSILLFLPTIVRTFELIERHSKRSLEIGVRTENIYSLSLVEYTLLEGLNIIIIRPILALLYQLLCGLFSLEIMSYF